MKTLEAVKQLKEPISRSKTSSAMQEIILHSMLQTL